MGGKSSKEDVEDKDELLSSFPQPLVPESAAVSDGFRRVAAKKEPGDALGWWNHRGDEDDASCSLLIKNKRLLAGTLFGAEIEDANQAKGQSGSVVMMLDVEVSGDGKKKELTLIVKTGTDYPAPDSDFYLQQVLYNQIPEVFLSMYAVQGQKGKGFTMVMERFGNSFPGKPGMSGYDPKLMISDQLPLIITTLAKFHATYWNDPRIAPGYLRNSEQESEDDLSSAQLDAFLKRRSSFVNPIALKVEGYTWLTDMSIANVMKGLGEDGMGMVGAKLRFRLLRQQMPGGNWKTEIPLIEGKTSPCCSYEQLWMLANQLRDMHGLPIGIGGIVSPNEHRKAFFERPTSGHWTLAHNDAKFENVLLDLDRKQAKVFDFDLVGLGSGPMDLSTFFISMWENAAESTETDVKLAFEMEMELAIRPYFDTLVGAISGDDKPTLLHVADRYYGSGSVSSVLIMNLLEAKGEKTFFNFLPRSVSFLRRCIYYWMGSQSDDTQTGRSTLV